MYVHTTWSENWKTWSRVHQWHVLQYRYLLMRIWQCYRSSRLWENLKFQFSFRPGAGWRKKIKLGKAPKRVFHLQNPIKTIQQSLWLTKDYKIFRMSNNYRRWRTKIITRANQKILSNMHNGARHNTNFTRKDFLQSPVVWQRKCLQNLPTTNARF